MDDGTWPQRLQTLVLRYLVTLARSGGPFRGATVFEVEVAEVARAVSRATEGSAEVSEPERGAPWRTSWVPRASSLPGRPAWTSSPVTAWPSPSATASCSPGTRDWSSPPGQG